MMSLAQAINAAMSTPAGTPEHAAARDLCLLRGTNPDGYPHVGSVAGNMVLMCNWQRTIAEQLIEQSLRDAMRQPAY